MIFSVSTASLINMFCIAMGIGICAMSFIQISLSAHVSKEIRRYFQLFMMVLILYITSHMSRQLMEGRPGGSIRAALCTVTFIEFLSSSLVSFMFSLVVLKAAHIDENGKPYFIALLAGLCVSIIILVINLFTGRIYFFDEGNFYHRGPVYVLSYLVPVLMLAMDTFLLIRYRQNFKKRIRPALWTYIIAPYVAIVIQSFTYGIQFIIFATVIAAVHMFQAIVRDQNESYVKQQLEHSRLATELNMAANIQNDMLPNTFPAFPERPEFDIYASMNPAKEVGGDFYDFFFIDRKHFCMVIADVSGKGVPAALFMMVSKIMIQNFALTSKSAAEALEAANKQICSNNREDMFVTAWLGIIDLDSGKLTASNAGHEYPVIKKTGEDFSVIMDKHGFVLGGIEISKYKDYELQLNPGDSIFLYTDGVTEATNASQELYGMDRMLAALNRNRDADPKELLAKVREDVNEFVGEAPQFDDLTMMCLKYKGSTQTQVNRDV